MGFADAGRAVARIAQRQGKHVPPIDAAAHRVRSGTIRRPFHLTELGEQGGEAPVAEMGPSSSRRLSSDEPRGNAPRATCAS